jgi:hydrogenase maturation protease
VTVPAKNLGSLVIGYGNPLRSDDGVGWQVAGRLAGDPRMAGAEILQRHQLTPELALDVSTADLVVLVDARSGPPPGTVTIERIERAPSSGTTWSHHLGPASLVGLAQELYGRAGEVHVISVGVASLEVGEGLSPAVEAAAGRVVEVVAGLVADAAAKRAAGDAGAAAAGANSTSAAEIGRA